PVYAHVAGESPHGHGSIGMLERLVSGWTGKTLVLVLLGFAATDFVITKTLSAADAAKHLIENPFWLKFVRWLDIAEAWQRPQMIVTMFLLVMLGAMFLRGFREVIWLAVAIVGVYLVLNAIVVGSSLLYLFEHPTKWQDWLDKLGRGDWHVPER